MIKTQIVDLLHKQGIKASVIEEDYSVRILTDKPVPEFLRVQLEYIRPVGIAFHFAIKVEEKIPIPQCLTKWYADTSKYMKIQSKIKIEFKDVKLPGWY